MSEQANVLNKLERQLAWLNSSVNVVGATLTFVYLSVIDPQPAGAEAVQPLNNVSIMVFVVIMIGLFTLGRLLGQRISRPLNEWQRRVIAGTPAAEIPPDVRRNILNFPLISTGLTFFIWVVAGVVFALLFQDESLRAFIGVVGVGGVLTAALYYFICDVMWRKALIIYFPDGQLSSIGGVRLSVRRRIMIVFFLIGPYPLALLTYLSLSRAQQLLTAPNPQALLANLVVLELFILIASLSVGLGMAIFMSRGLVDPLRQLQTAMGRVEQSDFTTRVAVVTNDELGYVGERFNAMTAGLQQGETLRNLLNVYVSPEVAREAIEHGAQLGGEMVECSVLFSDIRNFTGLSESLPPAQLIELLNRYMSAMVDVVIRHSGIVNKFGGDSLLAVFGTPINPIEFHAAAAIQSGLEMLAALDWFNAAQRQIGSIELHIGIGIATGPVIAGNVGGQGRLEYTVIGDTVNLASRLQSLTKEMGRPLLLNATAYEQAQPQLTLHGEVLPDMTIRGKSEPVQVVAPI